MGALACSQGGVARARPAARWATRAAQGRLTRTRTMYLNTPKSEYSYSAYEFLTRREGQSTRSHCQLNGLSENNVTHLFYLCMKTIVVDKRSWNRQNKSIIGPAWPQVVLFTQQIGDVFMRVILKRKFSPPRIIYL